MQVFHHDHMGPSRALPEEKGSQRLEHAGAALPRGYDLSHPDQVPQRVLDGMLWRSVHGRSAKPPPPGPNAVYERPGSDPDG